MLRYTELRQKPKEFLCATGVTDEEFQKILPVFAQQHLKPASVKPQQRRKKRAPRQPGGGRKAQLDTVEQKLLFILVYHKTAPLQTMHGLQFGLSQSAVNNWVHCLLPALQLSLQQLECAPLRDGTQLSAAAAATAGGVQLCLDGTERRLQRPVEDTQQRAKYSGKKADHTDKNLLLANVQTQRVVYLSATVEGKKHDKKLADESAISYPVNATLLQDTGFQGYAPDSVIVLQPKKSARTRTERGGSNAQSSDLKRAREG